MMRHRPTLARGVCACAAMALFFAGCTSDDGGVTAGADAGATGDSDQADATASDSALADSAAGFDDTGTDAVPGDDTGPAVDGAAADGGDVAAADVAADDVGADALPEACPTQVSCDDGLGCTEDLCTMPGAVCSWQLKANFCVIGKTCLVAGAPRPGHPCEVCDPLASQTKWTPLTDGAACEDAFDCVVDATCTSSTCAGVALGCDDDDACTADVCVEGKGCTYPPLGAPGEAPIPCDDADACTSGDHCLAGACAGAPLDCDDGAPCTLDACDLASGCSHTDADGQACSDGDACTADDACASGTCGSGAPTNCDDGNACTLDSCDILAGCVHLPTKSPCCTGKVSICDDGDACTTDLCDPQTGGCSQTVNTAVCDDDNACTAKDACSAGACAGAAIDCDDGDVCSNDACDPANGCVHVASLDGKACDDGDVCTNADVCTGGACAGSGQCACTPSFSVQVTKVTSLAIGKYGYPGEGLDLDGDAKTCAPSTSCSDGIDNAIGNLSGLANPQLVPAVEDGKLILLIELGAFKQGPIELAIHQGELDPANAGCDIQKAGCAWLADPALIDPLTCAATASLAGTLIGNKIKAGGKGTTFPFSLPVQAGVVLNVTLYDLIIEGTVTVEEGKVTTFDAILAGALPKAVLQKAIGALPDEGLTIPKDVLLSVLDGTVENDIDTDGDGEKDAASIALKIHAVEGSITGVAK